MIETGAAPVEAGAAPGIFWTAPPLFPGETVFILGGGPSLEGFDAIKLAGRRVIALNNRWKLKPDADVLLAPDRRWWRWNKGKIAFRGPLKITTQPAAPPGVLLMEYGGRGGLSASPSCLNGRNAGHQGINLAVHLGAARIVLLGFDQKADERGRTHDDPHRIPTDPADYAQTMMPEFETLIAPLARLGVEVLNATPGSALECFPKIKLWRVL